jgi:DNA polymerase (family X)
MNNREISSIFEHIADILEIKEDNVFKIRAYRTAASNISGLSRQLSEIYEEDPALLDNIPGIGKDLKAKIIEMVTTGHLEFYTRLIKEFPRGFLDLLDISGLGPKKLKKLADELNIKDVNSLEKACEKGELENISGMGKKTQEKMLQAIAHFRKREGRMLLPRAGDIADDIIKYLSGSGNFKKIEKAGSLRRGQETVGDIDLLAVVKDADKAMERFTSYPGVENLIARGTTKSSVKLSEGPQVDLRIVDGGCFGAALVYFTGSKQHNIKIRKIAKDKGCKVSEYGVFKLNGAGEEKFVAGRTEKELYTRLGMEWIPPELREERGEIEAALKGELPARLIKTEDIKGDLHMHTLDSDGRMTVEEMAEAAKKKGYKYIAITNHSKLVRVSGGMDEKRLLKHIEDIRKRALKIKGIEILAGVEVDILKDGKLDLEDYVLEGLDIVIAAIHSNFSMSKEDQTARVLRAMDNKHVNMLAHPSGRLITRRSPMELDMDRIFRKAVENNIILEINTHGDRIDLNDVHSKRAKEMGAKFAINTDSHDAAQMGGVAYGVITARRGWLEKKDVINTCSPDKVRKILASRK